MRKIVIVAILALCSISRLWAADKEVLREIYREVPAAYIEPLEVETLAVNLLKGLNSVDKKLQVGNDGSKVTLYYKGKVLKVLRKPDNRNDIEKWADLSAEIMDAAVEVSPLAAKYDFELADRMMQASVSSLDKDSKFYMNPEEQKDKRRIHVRNFAARREGENLYIKIIAFNKFTKKNIEEAVKSCGDCQGIILDLRGSPGGMLGETTEIADLFLDEGIIVSTSGRGGRDTVYYNAKDGDIWEGRPMAVLVDGGTASSAEVLAAALQEQGRAKIIGTSTFGKGSVQKLIPLSSGGTIAVTTAYFYTPSAQKIHDKGLTPDVCTYMMPATKDITKLLSQNQKLPCGKEEREKEGVDIDVGEALLWHGVRSEVF